MYNLLWRLLRHQQPESRVLRQVAKLRVNFLGSLGNCRTDPVVGSTLKHRMADSLLNARVATLTPGGRRPTVTTDHPG